MDERELVTRIIEGDQDAFEELVRGYQGVVYGRLRRFRQLSEAEVEELFQDVFLRLLENDCRALQAWNGQALGAYLARIAGNVGIDALRRRREVPVDAPDDGDEPRDPLEPPEDDPVQAVIILRQLRRMMNDAIARLAEGDQATVRSLYLDDLTYQEIAARFGITPNAAGVRITRARSRLATVIRDEFPALLEWL